MTEIWHPVVGFEGRYEVSNLGRLKSLNYRGHMGPAIMKVTPNYAGYNVVSLSDRRQYRVAVLVLEAFVGPRPEGMEVCHGRFGNTVDALHNVRWDTREENIAEREHAAEVRNGRAKLTAQEHNEVRRRRLAGEKTADLADEFGISSVRVSQIALYDSDWSIAA